MKFEIGDRVKVIKRNSELRGAIGTVVEIVGALAYINFNYNNYNDESATKYGPYRARDLMRIGKLTYKSDDNKTTIVAAGHNVRTKDYTKPNTLKGETEMKFKIGDRVQMVNPSSRLYKAIGTVVGVAGSFAYICFNYNDYDYDDRSGTKYGPYMASDFKLISKDDMHKAQTEAMMAAAGYNIRTKSDTNTEEKRAIDLLSDTDQDGDTMFKISLNSIYGMMGDYGIGGLTQMFNKDSIPEIRNVYFNDPLTCVIWKDGTKTFVKNADGDYNYDPEKALAMAISKKALGNKYNYYKEFEKWLPKENAKFSVKSLLGTSKELSKVFASFEAAVKELGEKAENPVEKAYLALLKVNDDPTSKDADFAAAIEEAIGYLGEALDD